jgi:hypothetical protein
MSDVEHKVVELQASSIASGGLEDELRLHEREGWELAATLSLPGDTVNLVFKRPRPLFDT